MAKLLPALPYPYRLRSMEADDLSRVAAIDREVNQSPWSLAGFSAELENPVARPVVVLVAKKIGGFGVSWLVGDEIQVQTLAVATVFQGRGLGELLLLQALWDGFERGGRLATLEARLSNRSAINLYRKYGFVEVGKRALYYKTACGRESAVLMNLTLDPTQYRPWLIASWTRLRNRLIEKARSEK